MLHTNHISKLIAQIVNEQFSIELQVQDIHLTPCKKEFEGDFTFVLFPLIKKTGSKPEELGEIIGAGLIQKKVISSYNIIKGFFNFSLPNEFWIDVMSNLGAQTISNQIKVKETEKYLIEYCSPNTNKPLHLGHIRNILLGWSVYKILNAIGHHVNTTQIVNDRGIAICKSMLAWSTFANGATPESTHIKSDHFVGDYYVLFETKFKAEYLNWQATDTAITIYDSKKKVDESKVDFFVRFKNEYFNTYSSLGNAAKKLLIGWEANDHDVIQLWNKMNQWVYKGFEETFKKLNISFDSYYYESQTYLLGKDILQLGLNKNVFYKEDDHSIWVDLSDRGLDKKLLLRADGTSVYITQDLGTAALRHEAYHADHYLHVVADEQDYHFKALFETLKKLEVPYASGMYHLSYGMVDLPTGKMKSREGTVVDADDLIDEVILEASQSAEERGELVDLSKEELNQLISKIGMAALKYFILKVHPKKRMIFDPKESVDMQGHTGPYIVNAFVRIKSILRKSGAVPVLQIPDEINTSEKDLLILCMSYPDILQESARQFDPSHLANFLYTLAKDFHRYYHDYRILKAESQNLIVWRLALCELISKYLEHGMLCLGIEMPERM